MAHPVPFNRRLEFEYGAVTRISPLVRRVIARNPSPFTFHGTGTYIVGRGDVAVIDPGPLLDGHVDALLAALEGERVTALLVTHTHLDHSPACAPLARATGAPSAGFGPHGAGRLEAGARVEEGADLDFVPDRLLRDGERVTGSGWTLECVHTPGHTSNHLCFALVEENSLFSGDHVMGWNTTIVSPPDGDMGAYIASLERLLQRADARYLPTHGAPIEAPRAYLRALLRHRLDRHAQIRACLEDGAGEIAAMVPRIYRELPERMHPAAARQVLSALVYMAHTGEVVCEGEPGLAARWRVSGRP